MHSASVGARISIHNPLNMPHPEITGFNAPPGHETSVAVRVMSVQRLKAPYTSNCTSTFPLIYLPFTSPHVDYSMFECSLACQRYHIQRTCKCLVEWRVRLRPDERVPSTEYLWCVSVSMANSSHTTMFVRETCQNFLSLET
jgi:hypothetical protein